MAKVTMHPQTNTTYPKIRISQATNNFETLEKERVNRYCHVIHKKTTNMKSNKTPHTMM